ncbi:hypothetical protein [Pontibacillus litoralis]|uniref:Uncharacterized protein n=1 Tax=Pontibacillus litoralis JSM 072002 TaxID=1385512 RepID=A0A0A5FZH0_9BACI|nr:hypothetical protein [Pontibacillus litoralis]KGX85194.1 hypothetical protein N784_09870 [Pontibacillus litoralis JSM 072002]
MKKVRLPKMCRFDFLSYFNRVTIRTFNKDIFILRPGLMVQNIETSEYKKIEEIYYDIRTVMNIEGKIVAKRKNRKSELYLQVQNAS